MDADLAGRSVLIFDQPFRSRRIRVLDLDPIGRAPEAIGLVTAVGDDYPYIADGSVRGTPRQIGMESWIS